MYKNVKICGVPYQIVVKNSMDMPNALGLCHSDQQQIWLLDSNTEETNTNVLLHEILHAVSDAYDLELSERQVNVLATALIALARDNPEYARRFFISAPPELDDYDFTNSKSHDQV